MVEVEVKRLFKIIKAVLEDGSERSIVARFGKVKLTLALRDAQSMKEFVEARAAKQARAQQRAAKSAGTRKVGLRKAGARKKPRAAAAAMPLDFGHCTPR
jgi:hypothetical protein